MKRRKSGFRWKSKKVINRRRRKGRSRL
uniref:50S ribosomal protein L34 n=2 Tax=Cyanidioschyzon merolae TaxID=45157 RepID=Q85G34_CYAM1|nr:50S ribosomal protein L34 [Cyanidioschyzon merolae strain 10D]QFV16959.1 50S ribosomal protein L34 [Cyanidioschyzon merolae]QFV17137.1 50S ribosomal protein L34 [Cyanidioschyzon merolae]BAC76157.1 50S ribosomal protein L34 [Cyanidioschyzon merolae strain 10D]